MDWVVWALKTAFSPIHAVLLRMVLLMPESREQDGIMIHADPNDGSFERVYERIAEARRLLERIDPARSRRVRELLGHILVRPNAWSAFFAGTDTCLLDRDLLESRSDAYIASVLVHEATHARLDRRGIAYTPRSRGRIEATCIREQNAFLDRLPRDEYPSADRLIEYLEGYAAADLRGDAAGWVKAWSAGSAASGSA